MMLRKDVPLNFSVPMGFYIVLVLIAYGILWHTMTEEFHRANADYITKQNINVVRTEESIK